MPCDDATVTGKKPGFLQRLIPTDDQASDKTYCAKIAYEWRFIVPAGILLLYVLVQLAMLYRRHSSPPEMQV